MSNIHAAQLKRAAQPVAAATNEGEFVSIRLKEKIAYALYLAADAVVEDLGEDARDELVDSIRLASSSGANLWDVWSRFIIWVADDAQWGMRSMLRAENAIKALDESLALLRAGEIDDAKWSSPFWTSTYALKAAQEREGVVLETSQGADLPGDLVIRAESWSTCGVYHLTCAYRADENQPAHKAKGAVWLTAAGRYFFADKNSGNPGAVWRTYSDKLGELIRAATPAPTA